jgi:hypothetical protein
MKNGAENTVVYLYGILPREDEFKITKKLENPDISVIPFQNVAAIVAERCFLDYKTLCKESLIRLILDHQRTLETLMDVGFKTIVPIKFGTSLPCAEKVRQLLMQEFDLLNKTLGSVKNVVEIDIACSWSDFNQVLNEIASHSRIRQTVGPQQENALSKIDSGSVALLIKGVIDSEKSALKKKILLRLKSLSDQFKEHEVMNEQMIFNTAFQVPYNHLALIEKEVDKLDAEFQGALNFRQVGPLPCYSFYTLEMKTLRSIDIENAKGTLGLDALTSVKKIKQAYLDKVKMFHPDMNEGGMADNNTFSKINGAYRIMADYLNAVKPLTPDVQVPLTPEAINGDTYFFKISE